MYIYIYIYIYHAASHGDSRHCKRGVKRMKPFQTSSAAQGTSTATSSAGTRRTMKLMNSNHDS